MLICSYMRTLKPTAVKEDYLRAIYRLQEKGAVPIRLVDIAKALGLSKSTVSERIQELSTQGYLKHARYADVEFTTRGYSVAKKLTFKHRIIEVFLHDTLRMSKDQIHAEAHLLEHAMSDAVIKKLADFLGNPTIDSHGTPIPKI